MSFHMDRKEFDEWLAEGTFDRIWSAYQYAINGGEQRTVDILRAETRTTKEWARRESERAERNGQYASNIEVELGKTRDELKATQKELEAVRKELEEVKPGAEKFHEALEGLEKAGWPCRLVELPQAYQEMGWELQKVREENARLQRAVDQAKRTLRALASHDPSWKDDFCRAEAALKAIELPVKGRGASPGPYDDDIYPNGLRAGDRVTLKNVDDRKYNPTIPLEDGAEAVVLQKPNDDFPEDAVQISCAGGEGAIDAKCLVPVRKVE